MRTILLLTFLSITLVACPRIRKGEVQPVESAEPTNGWPDGYTGWNKLNAVTLAPSPDETKQIARELFAKTTPNIGLGSILVKEQYDFVGGMKGSLRQVAVMRRSGGAANNGWEFLAFDPATKQRVDSSQCVSCHVIQDFNDYMFSQIPR